MCCSCRPVGSTGVGPCVGGKAATGFSKGALALRSLRPARSKIPYTAHGTKQAVLVWRAHKFQTLGSIVSMGDEVVSIVVNELELVDLLQAMIMGQVTRAHSHAHAHAYTATYTRSERGTCGDTTHIAHEAHHAHAPILYKQHKSCASADTGVTLLGMVNKVLIPSRHCADCKITTCVGVVTSPVLVVVGLDVDDVDDVDGSSNVVAEDDDESRPACACGTSLNTRPPALCTFAGTFALRAFGFDAMCMHSTPWACMRTWYRL